MDAISILLNIPFTFIIFSELLNTLGISIPVLSKLFLYQKYEINRISTIVLYFRDFPAVTVSGIHVLIEFKSLCVTDPKLWLMVTYIISPIILLE